MLYMVTFTINIPPMLVYIYIYTPYMDPVGFTIFYAEFVCALVQNRGFDPSSGRLSSSSGRVLGQLLVPLDCRVGVFRRWGNVT